MRKTVLWALLAVLLSIGLAGQSYAAQYTCQVNAVGLEQDGNLYVYLTDDVAGAFVRAKFLLGPVGNDAANNYYATALDAIGARINVYANVNVGTATTPGTVITDLTYPYAGLVAITDNFTP